MSASVTATTTSAFDSDTDSDGDVFMGEADDDEEGEGEGDEAMLTQSAVSPLFGSLAQQQRKQQKSGWFGSSKPAAAATTLIPEPLKIDRHSEKNCWNHCDYPSECRWGKAYGVPTPATATFPPITADADVLAQTTADSRDALGTLEQQAMAADTIDGVAEANTNVAPPSTTSATTTKIAFTDLASLVQSAKRRKSRSEVQGPSPLSSSSSSPLSSSSAPPVTSCFTEDMSDLSVPVTATSFEEMRLVSYDEESKTDCDGAENSKASNSLARAFDEFESDFRRSMERASGLFGGFVGRGSGKAKRERGDDRK